VVTWWRRGVAGRGGLAAVAGRGRATDHLHDLTIGAQSRVFGRWRMPHMRALPRPGVSAPNGRSCMRSGPPGAGKAGRGPCSMPEVGGFIRSSQHDGVFVLSDWRSDGGSEGVSVVEPG
jgi:hypothetical protein